MVSHFDCLVETTASMLFITWKLIKNACDLICLEMQRVCEYVSTTTVRDYDTRFNLIMSIFSYNVFCWTF